MAPPAGAPEGAGAPVTGKGGFVAVSSASSRLYFFVNGKEYNLTPGKDFMPETTLLTWLRAKGLTGTKLGCGEGGCGACTLSASSYDEVNPMLSRDSAGLQTISCKLQFCELLCVFACDACLYCWSLS